MNLWSIAISIMFILKINNNKVLRNLGNWYCSIWFSIKIGVGLRKIIRKGLPMARLWYYVHSLGTPNPLLRYFKNYTKAMKFLINKNWTKSKMKTISSELASQSMTKRRQSNILVILMLVILLLGLLLESRQLLGLKAILREISLFYLQCKFCTSIELVSFTCRIGIICCK